MSLGPDFSLDLSGHLLDEGVHRGWEEVGNYVRGLGTTWTDFRLELEHMVGGGDVVVALIRTRAVGRNSGVSVEEKLAHVWTLADGMPTRLRLMSDREAALRLAGAAGGQ